MNSVDIGKLNSSIDEDADKLPNVPSFYDEYVNAGIIPSDLAKGGATNNINLGLVVDTRDKEANPNKGIWTEVFLFIAPGIIGNKNPYTGYLPGLVSFC